MRLLWLFIQVALAYAIIPKIHNDHSKHEAQKLHEREEFVALKAVVQELTNRIAKQDETINVLAQRGKRQEEMIEELVKSLNRETSERNDGKQIKQNPSCEASKRTNRTTYVKKDSIRKFDVSDNATVHYQKTEVACLEESLQLTCSAPSEIFITGAIYGYNTDEYCILPCCPPHPTDDCQGDVKDYDPDTWLSLNNMCNNETSCEFQYQGGVVPGCSDPEVFADYMVVMYSCFPVDPNEVVAFTAVSYSLDYYAYEELVDYPFVMTNLGGYYDFKRSMFRCPYNGLYLFTVSILAREQGIGFHIMKNGSAIATARADNPSEGTHCLYPSAGNTVLSVCTAGELVWVQCDYEGYLYSNEKYSDNTNTFSGVLLYRLD